MKDYFAVVQALRNATILYRIDRRPGGAGGCVSFSEIATLNKIINDMAQYRSDSGIRLDDSLSSLWFPDGLDPTSTSQ